VIPRYYLVAYGGWAVRKMQSKVFPVVLLALASLGLAGCPQRTNIARINRDPARFAGKEVTIAGRVQTSFGAMGTGVFAVDDGTGRMWVFSERWGIPGRDARVAVTGRIEQGFSFHGRNFATVLRETRRERD
jgi:hypothetical protein